MEKLDEIKKHNISGGISQAAIFGIISAIGIGVNLITNIASGVLNAKANKKQRINEPRKQYNLSYKKDCSVNILA